MSTLLEVKNLKKYFPIHGGIFNRVKGNVYAVDGVSFQLKQGQTLGLVGESGCGKSTLGRTLLRLYEPTAGEIWFKQQNLVGLSNRQMRPLRRDIQMVFQDPYSSLNPRMTIADILKEPFIIHKAMSGPALEKRVAELVDVVGLPNAALSKYPHEFSGGQRQRVGIARAIALQPSLIIADEPVSALDVSIRSQVLNLLSDLKTQLGLTYIFISHDLAVVEHMSDQVAVMYLGRIVEYAPRDQLYDQPSHPYTKALLQSIPTPVVKKREKKDLLPGDVPSPVTPPSGCHLHPRCPMAQARCRNEVPSLRPLSPKAEHLVACHYA